MARSRLTALAVLAVTINTAFLTQPAGAQFGSIFGDAPPRPPANVPRGNQLPPPDLGRGDLPPSQPQAPPMSLPPSSRPGAGAVQSQPLAPPPGGVAAPAAVPLSPLPPQGEAPQGVVRSTPGLLPGIRQPRGTPG